MSSKERKQHPRQNEQGRGGTSDPGLLRGIGSEAASRPAPADSLVTGAGVSGSWSAPRPGDGVRICAFGPGVMVLGKRRKLERVKLVIFLHEATLSIVSTGIRRAETEDYDLSAMLARWVVPRPLRPVPVAVSRDSFTGMPWAAGLDAEVIGKHDAARSMIPHSLLVTDTPADYHSVRFRSICQGLGISIQECSGGPRAKSLVERVLCSVDALFAVYLPGYTGGGRGLRGRALDQERGLLDEYALAELFERWVSVDWQNKLNPGLRDPINPEVISTPNSMCDAMYGPRASAPIPLTSADYIGLMPIVYRTIQRDGIHIRYRRYNSAELQRCRQSQLCVGEQLAPWPVRMDPYNPTAVWIRNKEDDSWIQCNWMNSDAGGAFR